MPDNEAQIELNFIEEVDLSRNGMIREIKTEFDRTGSCARMMCENWKTLI